MAYTNLASCQKYKRCKKVSIVQRDILTLSKRLDYICENYDVTIQTEDNFI